ncbi:MAG: DNA polymerase III subunit delta [Schwartzia sp.]|nr:DNA polymerase III subunit delta [Schwartzia sp. (in: firmicutes)]
MKYGEFMAAVRKGIPHVMLLAGEEPYYIGKAETAVLRALLPEEAERAAAVQYLERDPSLGDLTELLATMPFLSDKTVTVLRGTELFREKKSAGEETAQGKTKGKAKDKALEGLLSVLSDMPETNYVIFESGAKADKRKKLTKTVEKVGAVLDAEPERPWTIDNWLRGKLAEMGRSFDREATAYFMNAVSVMKTISLSFLDRELDKLALYTDAPRFSRADLERAFSSVPEVSGFALYEAVSDRDVKKALSVLEREIQDGTYLPLILAGLVRHVRQLWKAKLLTARGVRGKALGQPLELNPFIAEKLGRAAQAFDEKTLRAAFLELADADYLLKTGQAGPELLEHAVILLCGRGAAAAKR